MQQSEIERGERAESLLKDPLIKEAFSAIRMKLLESLEGCAVGDIDTQHNIALSLQILKQVQGQFHRWIRDGQLEENKKAERTSLLEKMRRVL